MTPAKKKSMLTAAMADWDGLHQDLLALILRKVKVIKDFVAFGMVCIAWHKVFASNKPYLPMNLYIPEMSDKRCIGLNYGWILRISSGEKWHMSLVHPLTGSQIELPPQTSVAEYDEYDNLPSYMFRSRAVLSADPSSDFVLMIIHSGGKYLGYWKPGDREWTRVEQLRHFQWTYFSDVTYYQDQSYAITCGGEEVWSYKVLSHGPVVARQVVTTHALFDIRWPYIVGNTGALLVLARQERITYGPKCPRLDENGKKYYAVDWEANFQVYELDLINRSSNPIKNVGDNAIFVGYNTSISLDRASRFPGVKSNHIYYTDDRASGSIYNIQNELTTPFQIEESSSLANPPFWFIPAM